MTRRRIFTMVPALLGMILWLPAALADEGRPRWRLGLAVGGFDARDEIRSDAANVLTLLDDSGAVAVRYVDPRDDASASRKLQVGAARRISLSAQVGFGRTFLLESSIGYEQSDVGQVEIQAHFAGGTGAINNPGFRRFELSAGRLRRLPVALTAIERFRPDAPFRPYVGLGIGYSFLGFEPSRELDRLSLALEDSTGLFVPLLPEDEGGGVGLIFEPGTRLSGVGADVDDAAEWHVAAGAEYRIAQRWSLFLDIRYLSTAGSLDLRFDGRRALGRGVPQRTTSIDSAAGRQAYGPLRVTIGGLIDGNGDGVPDPGLYYVKGGDLGLGGFLAQLGLRRDF